MSDPRPEKPVEPTPLEHTPAAADPRPDAPVPPTALEHTPVVPSTAATLTAEAFGTFLLVLGVISTALFAAGFGEGTEAANKGVGFLGVALAVGLTVVAGAYAFGPISGGHFNPAVTLGLAAAGRFPWRGVIGYILAQIIGGLVATTVIVLIGLSGPDNWLSKAQDGGFASNGFDSLSPGGYGILGAIVVETLFTALFVLVILGVTHATRGNPALAGLAIGLTLTLIHLATIPIDNTSVNPARSIAAAAFAQNGALGQVWLFIIAPLIGAALGGLIWRYLLSPGEFPEELAGLE